MAHYDPAIIDQLRRMIDDTVEPYKYSLETLEAYLDVNNGDLRAVASVVWREKAAKVATLVNVREGTSSRDLGKIYDNYLKMAESFETVIEIPEVPTTRAIERI